MNTLRSLLTQQSCFKKFLSFSLLKPENQTI